MADATHIRALSCPHPRIEGQLPAIRRGSASRQHETGWHLVQWGTCLACSAQMTRFVDLPPQGEARVSPWLPVGARPEPRRKAA